MKKLTLLISNSLSLVFTLIMNYLASSSFFNGNSVGDISKHYETLFTPAGYAFSIWGLIYLLLICFVAYQWFLWFNSHKTSELKHTGIWFTISNVVNGFWVYAWTTEHLGISVILMIILLLSLIKLTLNLRLEIWDAPVRIIVFVWWPICVYLGWIIVATVANVAAFFVSLGWDGAPLSEISWTILLITVACSIYCLLIYFRNMREAAAVGVWALVAIAVKQWTEHPEIAIAAVAASLLLVVLSAIQAFKNRDTLPLQKIKRGEI